MTYIYLDNIYTYTGTLIWAIDLGAILYSNPCIIPNTTMMCVATTAGDVFLINCLEDSFSGECSDDSKECSGSLKENNEEYSSDHMDYAQTNNNNNNKINDENSNDNNSNNNNKNNSNNDNKNNNRIIAKIKLQGEIYSSPIVYNNIVYIGCRDDKIHAISIQEHIDIIT